MGEREQYAPGPASGARVEKEGEKWTLILVRELRHSPEKVWQALTDPAHVREWAPFDVDGSLGTVGTVKLTWVGTPTPLETRVTRADAPKMLEYNDIRWELEPLDVGTRLTLWHSIDRRYIAWGAAGWHICFDVLERLLAGEPIRRIAGPERMQFRGRPAAGCRLPLRSASSLTSSPWYGGSIPAGWGSWRCSRSPRSCSPVCTCSCCRMPPSGAAGDAPAERAAGRTTMARRRGAGRRPPACSGGSRTSSGAACRPRRRAPDRAPPAV